MKNAIKTGLYPHDSHLKDNAPRFRVRVSRVGLLDDGGQSLVEFALTMPLFILILIGMAEIARVAWASIEVSNAARAGVQYAAQSTTSAQDTTGIGLAVSNDGTNLTGLSMKSTSYYCTCSTAPNSTIACIGALATCPSPATILHFVQVTTSATVSPLFHYPGLPSTFNLQGYAQMEVEQ